MAIGMPVSVQSCYPWFRPENLGTNGKFVFSHQLQQRNMPIEAPAVLEDPVKEQERSSGISTSSSFSRDQNTTESMLNGKAMFELQFPREQLYVKKYGIKELPLHQHRKAINLLMKLCWTIDVSNEVLWLTVQMYYGFQANCEFKKGCIQTTILTFLILALKINDKFNMKISTLTQYIQKDIPIIDVILMEDTVLKVFDHNIIIPSVLDIFLFNYSAEQTSTQKVLFLAELLMLEDQTIFFSGDKIEDIISIVEKRGNCQATIQTLRGVIARKEDCSIILSKYSSKFDPHELLQTIF